MLGNLTGHDLIQYFKYIYGFMLILIIVVEYCKQYFEFSFSGLSLQKFDHAYNEFLY